MEGLESFFTSGQQTTIFLLSCLFGLPIGVVYDIFRVIRMTVPHGKIAVVIEDILFFFLYAVFLMSFTAAFARSEFRFYYLIGNLLGFTVYFFTIGRTVTGVLRKIIGFLKKILEKPIKKLTSICKKNSLNFVRSLQNININKKISKIHLIEDGNMLYNSNTEKKNKRKNVKKIVSKKSR